MWSVCECTDVRDHRCCHAEKQHGHRRCHVEQQQVETQTPARPKPHACPPSFSCPSGVSAPAHISSAAMSRAPSPALAKLSTAACSWWMDTASREARSSRRGLRMPHSVCSTARSAASMRWTCIHQHQDRAQRHACPYFWDPAPPPSPLQLHLGSHHVIRCTPNCPSPPQKNGALPALRER